MKIQHRRRCIFVFELRVNIIVSNIKNAIKKLKIQQIHQT